MLDDKYLELLESRVDYYNRPRFIESDPIFVPHQFTKLQDIEIAALMAAIFAWGQRKTIINKTIDFLARMDNTPHDFILNHTEKDLLAFNDFKHRTFNSVDAFNFIHFFRCHYSQENSLETAFYRESACFKDSNEWMTSALIEFKRYFTSNVELKTRTLKHVASPLSNATCKRLNMFLRWMVRKDNRGVDFGLWSKFSPSQLLCPLDIHVNRVSRKIGLLKREQNDFKSVLELSENLKLLDAKDPAKYDFALFSLGIKEGFA